MGDETETEAERRRGGPWPMIVASALAALASGGLVANISQRDYGKLEQLATTTATSVAAIGPMNHRLTLVEGWVEEKKTHAIPRFYAEQTRERAELGARARSDRAQLAGASE